MEPDFSAFSAADFLTNDLFVGHMLRPTAKSESYWDAQRSIGGINEAEWALAVQLFELVQRGLMEYASKYLSDDKIASLLIRIQEANGIASSEDTKALPWGNRAWLVAASLGLLMLVGLGYWLNKGLPSDYGTQVAELEKGYTELVNEAATERHYHLPDSTHIVLSPHSKLSYDATFNDKSRKVILTGEAEFDVAKDAKRPFYVFANKVVTKVLGTRFLVRAVAQDQEVRVMVRSGQVSVSANQPVKGTPEVGATNGVILTPNQQAVFYKQQEKFNKTLVENPVLLEDIAEQKNYDFTYDDVKVASVFQQLESAYGILIQFDRESLSACGISASLNRESFDQKLDIICKTINATFHKIDGQIIIQGGFCQ
ncbi:uncharacterized protein DUF4974 [Dyadobacter jejuensis]|uniref:Uncharacterized protein DUF4974 n=1 Tax=Dyadobacter jejuensis TaxID=1082580 RepID=A0A316B5U4_9BACT|nr:FecR family protein [Dyadobacter jejuensis]PWJ58017.1 uncharacterized protein DUF4974 [Dyadobacter jejuensis]